MTMGGRVRDEDVGARGTVMLGPVEDELRAPARDEIELLMAELWTLGVWLDDVDARLLRGIRIRTKGFKAQGEPHGPPRERARPGYRLDVVEANDLRLARAQ